MNGLPFGAVAVAVASVAWSVGPSVATACSCMAPPPPEVALAESDHVFEGRVTAIDETSADGATPPVGDDDRSDDGEGTPPRPTSLPGAVAVTFDVVRTWKGADAETLTVKTAGNTAACGFPFERGETYLVYAIGEAGSEGGTGIDDAEDHDAPVPRTGLCTRTKAIRDAGDDLSALGAGVVPVDVTGPGDRAGDGSSTEDEADPKTTPGTVAAAGAPNGRGGCQSCRVGAGGLPGPVLAVGMLLAWALLGRRHPR